MESNSGLEPCRSRLCCEGLVLDEPYFEWYHLTLPARGGISNSRAM